MSGIHVLQINPQPLRFRLNYTLPPVNIATVPEKDARWVILPDYLLVYARPEVVKPLCDQYGKDRLVLFDYSDHGTGDYPCTVFAMNTKLSFPPSVKTFLLPVYKKFITLPNGVGQYLPELVRSDPHWDITFVGDESSHPCRAPGSEWLANSTLKTLNVTHADSFLCTASDVQSVDDVYADSFNARLMWCPPSRRPITWRFAEALNAGVPILSTPVWETTRLPPRFDFLKTTITTHLETMSDFGWSVQRALSDLTSESKAQSARANYLNYMQNFWQFVADELES